MKKVISAFAAVCVVIAACHKSPPALGAGHSTLSVTNETDSETVVYVAFGADSKVQAPSWKCQASGNLNCSFKLAAHASQPLELSGQYLNATFSFNGPVGCNTTKAELNINNPKWYDIADISLVDGYNTNMTIVMLDSNGIETTLGPTNGKTGNEKVLGVFPFGCDICTARQHPPCGIAPGSDGCKSGSQYKPDVACQYQGYTMGGASTVKISLVK